MTTFEGRYLVTTDNWFFGPDGEQYRSAWGRCRVYGAKELFGFDPTRPSTNWYLSVGDGGREIIIAGCQVHYSIRCDNKPKIKEGQRTTTDGVTLTINDIYIGETE